MYLSVVANRVPRLWGSVGSKLLRNAMAPGVMVWVLLIIAHALTPKAPAEMTIALVLIGALYFALFSLTRHVLVGLPVVPEHDVQLLLAAGLFVLLLEAAYFGGLPIFGQVKYNEFGFPVLHHIVFAMWAAPVLAPRRSGLYLGVALFAAAVMFNRQMMLLALIGYLLRSGMRNILLPMLIIGAMVVLGSIRNELHDVQESVVQGGEFVSGPLGSVLFWGYLYVLGPYMATFGADDPDAGSIEVTAYWNTVPEWAVLTKIGVPVELSLALFYPLAGALVLFLTRVKLFEARVFGILTHVLCFVTFFSSTLLSTPVIGSALVISFVRRIQQVREPSTSSRAE